MAITYVAAGSLASGAVSGTPGLPAGISVGDLLIMQVVSASPTDATVSTPAGWDYIDSFESTIGVFGVGTGPRRMTFLARVYAAGDAAPSIVLPSGTNSVVSAEIFAFHRSAGTGWRYAAQFGEEDTSTVSFTAPTSDVVTWAPNDFVLLGYGLPASGTTLSAEAIVAAGVTFGTITERADAAVAVGAGIRFASATGAVTAGTVSVVASINATLSVAGFGVAGLIRIREASSTLTAVTQGVEPERVLITATGLAAENINTISLQRVVSGDIFDIRGSVGVSLLGDDSFVRTDAEQPFGVAFSYQAILVDALGDTWIITSNSLTQNITNALLSDALTGLGLELQIVSWPQKDYSRDSAVFNINGRIVVVDRPRSTPSSTLTVATASNDDRNQLNELLSNATDGIIQLRQQRQIAGVGCVEYDDDTDAYLAITADSFLRNGRFISPSRLVSMTCIEVEPWPAIFEAHGSTLLDIYNKYPDSTLQRIADVFTPGTLLSIAQFDWTV